MTALLLIFALPIALTGWCVLKSGSDAEDYIEWELRMRERDAMRSTQEFGQEFSMPGKKKCEYCGQWTGDTSLHRVEGKLVQLCEACGENPTRIGFEVECGDLHEVIYDVLDSREAVVNALEKSPAKNLGVLLRVRKRPVGQWGYIDTLSLVTPCGAGGES